MAKSKPFQGKSSSGSRLCPTTIVDQPTKTTAIKTRMPTSDAARNNLGDQVKLLGSLHRLNLSAMYRASGQPAGIDPWTWVESAAPVIDAIDEHKCPAQETSRFPAIHRLKVAGDEDLLEYDYPGDCMTAHLEIALVYSVALDDGLPEDVEPPFDNRSHDLPY